MKCSENWLHDWINPNLTSKELSEVLTMGGLEVESIQPAASAFFKNIVVGQIVKAEKHPDADQLWVCQVDVGHEVLHIVCGAPNVAVGLKGAVAKVGGILPNQQMIKRTQIRSVESEGMLLSAHELGLADDNSGLLMLPPDAMIGQEIWEYFHLEDTIFDITITPNRGDCLSIKGLAREVSALTGAPLNEPPVPAIAPTSKDGISLEVMAQIGCPRYVGRIIRDVKADVASPIWLKERLRRSGIRSISAIVDVTNYVMLELGQPMHAFDLDRIAKGIVVRDSKAGECISLLDGNEKTLDDNTLVIADHEKPLAIAGVMGGLESSVTLLTHDILLESAYFNPMVVARQRQFYHLSSESAYRFERGIDPTIQIQAIERATRLILDIAGGNPGPIVESQSPVNLPASITIELWQDKITGVLGVLVDADKIEIIFNRLKLEVEVISTPLKKGWKVKIPPYRPDLQLAEDLIEEIARIYGYDQIPTHFIQSNLWTHRGEFEERDLFWLKKAFSDQGFHEIISYSFIAPRLQQLLDPAHSPCELINPINADMSAMRTTLWPGLINTYLYNKSRQQLRFRLFEIGNCFISENNAILEHTQLAGLIAGKAFPEQWGLPTSDADFFDLKGSLETVLHFLGQQLTFEKASHPALHPGQSAAIYQGGQKIGVIGGLHPSLLNELNIEQKIFLFELDLNLIKIVSLPRLAEVSKFPEIRRDIAILVNAAIPARDIQDTIKVTAGDWLKDVFVFDVYQGKGIETGLKSIALGLVLQHPTRTLVDDEAAALMDRVIAALRTQLGAELRS